MCQDVSGNVNLNQTCWKKLLLAMSHGSSNRSTHQTAEPWMEERIVTKTEKGEGVQVQNQGDANRFFWCP